MMNSDDEIALRRYMNNLENSGAACILFGFWTVVKLFMELTMDSKTYNQIVVDVDDSLYSAIFIRLVIIIVALIIALIIMYFHLRIGVAAIRYSKGKKKRRTFLFLTAVIMIINFLSIGSNFRDETTNELVIKSTGIATTLVDLTFTFILFDIISSSVKIGSLRQKLSRNADQRSD